MSERKKSAQTNPPPPDVVTVTLPDNRRWDRNNESSAEFSRATGALWCLVHGATSEPPLSTDELKAACGPAFNELERQRSNAEATQYLARFPNRRERYSAIAKLLGVADLEVA